MPKKNTNVRNIPETRGFMRILLTLIREEFQMAYSLVVITTLDGGDYFTVIQRELGQVSTIATMFDGDHVARTIIDLADSKCARL